MMGFNGQRDRLISSEGNPIRFRGCGNQGGYDPFAVIDEKLDAFLVQIVRFACTAASLSTQKYGGITSVPDIAQVSSLLDVTIE